jgi:hypothetical protein
MIYIPSFIKIGSGIQKLFGGGTHKTYRQQGDFRRLRLLFQNKVSRLIIKVFQQKYLVFHGFLQSFLIPYNNDTTVSLHFFLKMINIVCASDIIHTCHTYVTSSHKPASQSRRYSLMFPDFHAYLQRIIESNMFR